MTPPAKLAEVQAPPGGKRHNSKKVVHDERRRFFERASQHTPFVGLESDGGALIILPTTGDRAAQRLLFAKRQDGGHRALRRAAQIVKGHALPGVQARWFVDVGAGVGLTSLAALRTHGFAHACCIEPNPDLFKALRANLLLNGLEDQATCINARAGAAGSVVMKRHKTWGDWRPVVDEAAVSATAKGRGVSVISRELDTLVEDGTLDPANIGLVLINPPQQPTDVLAGARSLASVPTIVEFGADQLDDDIGWAAFESLASERYDRVVDLGLDTRDAVITDISQLRSIADRWQHARERRAIYLLLLPAR